jgi:hypothetical protein
MKKNAIEYDEEPGEELREEFEREFGKNKKTGYGQWLDMTRLPHGGYRSFATHFAWKAYRMGKGIIVDK